MGSAPAEFRAQAVGVLGGLVEGLSVRAAADLAVVADVESDEDENLVEGILALLPQGGALDVADRVHRARDERDDARRCRGPGGAVGRGQVGAAW